MHIFLKLLTIGLQNYANNKSNLIFSTAQQIGTYGRQCFMPFDKFRILVELLTLGQRKKSVQQGAYPYENPFKTCP